MRLLQLTGGEGLRLVERHGSEIPKYAILSHTWGSEGDEITFEDINNGTTSTKTSLRKVLFCGQQARRDGLDYFWVDSCCIDKSSSAELSEAINSMFRWYADAETCYVYLADVYGYPAEPLLSKSRWFTRGWTLQELLAPSSVRFFDRDWLHIGTKSSLGSEIATITGIPISALRGEDLSSFSIKERLSWKGDRRTTREEDEAYCMLGLFGIHIVAIYGERRDNAWKRLLKETSELAEPHRSRAPSRWQGLFAPRSSPAETYPMQHDTAVRTMKADAILRSGSPSRKVHSITNISPASFWLDRYTTQPPIFSIRMQGSRPPDPYVDAHKLPGRNMLAVLGGGKTAIVDMQDIPDTKFAYVGYSRPPRSDDRDRFLEDADRATRSLGFSAYWCATNCLDMQHHPFAVYRMSDIVSRSQCLIIVLEPFENYSYDYGLEPIERPLKRWLSNCWSLEELLLSPRDRPIVVFRSEDEPRHFPKRELASLVSDIPVLLDLVEHFEGRRPLDRLDLVTSLVIAVDSLKLRDHYWSADRCYVLSSFLPSKPAPVPTDSSFQAFVRIMLSNSVDLLLERLICLQPRRLDQPWHDFADTWHVRLHDIDPACRISGMCPNDVLVLDAFKGAPISFMPTVETHHQKRPILRRWFSSNEKSQVLNLFVLLRGCPTIDQIREEFRLSSMRWTPDSINLNHRQDFSRLEDEDGFDRCRRLSSYTIVNTTSATVTSFHAAHAPEALVLGGRAWGQLRVLLCSFNIESRTFHREAVLRLDSAVEDMLVPVEQIHLSLQSQEGTVNNHQTQW